VAELGLAVCCDEVAILRFFEPELLLLGIALGLDEAEHHSEVLDKHIRQR
jgi:hypothetical protein